MLKPPSTRKQLASWLKARGYIAGAEIGVERGRYSETLCQAGLSLICVDPWQEIPGYREHVPQARLDEFYAETCARLAQYPVAYLRMTSAEAAREVMEGSLDFVYIDADHSEDAVRADIAAWTPKVRAGGVVAGHDYNRSGVRAAVGHPAFITDGDRSPSWVVYA